MQQSQKLQKFLKIYWKWSKTSKNLQKFLKFSQNLRNDEWKKQFWKSNRRQLIDTEWISKLAAFIIALIASIVSSVAKEPMEDIAYPDSRRTLRLHCWILNCTKWARPSPVNWPVREQHPHWIFLPAHLSSHPAPHQIKCMNNTELN